MILGIVGSEAKKFTKETERAARNAIYIILSAPGVTGVSSGHCHLGGIDIWAEEEADIVDKERLVLGLPKLIRLIYPPKNLQWATGYKPRNLQIAKASNELHCITVKELPVGYHGMRFDDCYHCKGKRPPHIKSGGCYTLIQGQKMGKKAFWHIIE